MNDLLIGIKTIGIVAGCYAAFMFLRFSSRLLGRWVMRRLEPTEAKLLQWLQDRATARALGVDVGIIRARRKIDFPDH